MKNFKLHEQALAFKRLTVTHKKQHSVKERLTFAAQFSEDVMITVLTGPTGSGKSTVLSMFAKEYLRECQHDMTADPSLRPIIYTLATASGHKAFDWKRLFRDAFVELKDPFRACRETRNDGRKAALIYPGESPSAAALREQLENEFQARQTRFWIIDEAQHVIRGGRSGKPGDQYDVLKSLAQTAGVRLILCGPYDLPEGMASSGQLARRGDVIALNRYRWPVAEELKEFGSALQAVMQQMQAEFAHPDAKENLQFFYVGTLGCVGIFKDWATRAYALALQEKATKLQIEHFKRTRMDPRRLATINAEIVASEASYGDDNVEPDEDLIRAILAGLMSGKGRPPEPGASGATVVASRTPRPNKPGERKPTRDAVGMEV